MGVKSRMLRRPGGYRRRCWAADPDQFGLVVTDYNMPGLSGLTPALKGNTPYVQETLHPRDCFIPLDSRGRCIGTIRHSISNATESLERPAEVTKASVQGPQQI